MHSVHTTPCSVGFLVVFIGLLHCGRVHALMRRCIGSNGRHARAYCVDRGSGAGLRRGACMQRMGAALRVGMHAAGRHGHACNDGKGTP